MYFLSLIFLLFLSGISFGQESIAIDSSKYDLVCYHPKKKYLEAFGNLKGIIPHGEWILFNEKGKLQAKGKFKNGERHGKWEYYDEEGKLMESGRYRKGKKHGIWLVYEDMFVHFNDGLVVEQNVFK